MSYSLPQKYLLGNRYRIEKQLGQGGFGITYKAFDEKLKKTVCIKELYLSGSSTRSENFSVQSQSIGHLDFSYFKNKFLEEGQKLAAFNHPSIVRVLDFFEANNTAYMVMDFVEGENLKQFVTKHGVLPEDEAMNYFLQLLDAVEKVHKANILHRDIKPENILITPDKRIVLIDFGTAKFQAKEDETAHIGQSTMAVVSPKYAAPEQFDTQKPKAAFTDVYSLGATLYCMLTATEPIGATGRTLDDLPSPKSINNTISNKVSDAIEKAMKLKPQDRFQKVIDFRSALLANDSHVLDNVNDKNEVPYLSFAIWGVVGVVLLGLILYNVLPELVSRDNKNNEQKVLENDTLIVEESIVYNADTIETIQIESQIWSKYNLNIRAFAFKLSRLIPCNGHQQKLLSVFYF